jgi:hypothetical protein
MVSTEIPISGTPDGKDAGVLADAGFHFRFDEALI